MPQNQRGGTEWRWRYSPMFGIMFGPVPVGIIVVIPLLIVLYAYLGK